jgi:crotonobetainyl-CoA:carnitine CoA-transferase CaiB-like acyl-CoA transferase
MTEGGVLAGVRVLDLSRLLPGPFCTQLLCDLGADVVKVEDVAGGDYLRYTPPLAADGMSVLFHALNRGKRSVALDLKRSDDRDRFLALCDDADVVVESFRPGVLDKLGLGVAALQARNPRLVCCAISGYGSNNGARRLRAGHDVNYVATSGALSLMATPTLLPVQVADLAGGAWPAAMQICAALVGRARTGRGAVIDVSMTAGVMGLLTMPLGRAAVGEDVAQGKDLLAGRVPSYGVYATSDGFVAVGALEPKFWAALCATIERPDLAERGFDDDGEAQRALQAVLATKTTAEWSATFGAADCCVEPVRDIGEVANDAATPHIDIALDDATVRCFTLGLGVAGHTPRAARAPTLGEHTDEVCGPRAR